MRDESVVDVDIFDMGSRTPSRTFVSPAKDNIRLHKHRKAAVHPSSFRPSSFQILLRDVGPAPLGLQNYFYHFPDGAESAARLGDKVGN